MEALYDVSLKGIAQLLVHDRILDKKTALQCQEHALACKLSLLQYLVNNDIIPAKSIAASIVQHFRLPFIDLDLIDTSSIPTSLINEALLRRHHILPLYTLDNHLYVATDDPSNQDALKEIQFHTGLPTSLLIVETNKLDALMTRILHQKEHQGLTDYFSESNALQLDEDDTTDDAPIVKFVNRLLIEAVQQGASDIHFEPYESNYRIRYRQDGILHEISSPPSNLAGRISARIKIMSNLDVAERRTPQDGRFKIKCANSPGVDFRVSSCPTVAGEKIVIRILDTQSANRDIDDLGFSPSQKERFMSAIHRSQGMILVTGPTGSGKTVTLYSALNFLNTSEKNISTAEDPVEINLPGINQVNINPNVGLTFAETLRAFLRQDPDVIMIGEIRDLETAEIAVQAAQTGHLVLSTLHTNSAAETLTRLINIGVPLFNIASSISLIIAQRLARRLCSHCKMVRSDLTSCHLIELGFAAVDAKTLSIYQANGCNQCTNGYRGRIALFEIIPMSQELNRLIMLGKSPHELLKQAQTEGMLTLYQDGLEKIKRGLTSIEEIKRVTIEQHYD